VTTLRRNAVATAALITGAAGALALWGVVIEPRLLLETRRVSAGVPGLPPQWRGRRVAVLADWQVGMWWANIGMVRRAIDAVIRERPAALLVVGDFVYAGRDALTSQLRLLRELVAPLASAGIATFAVLGNHDWAATPERSARDGERAESVRCALEAGGVRVLRNEAAALPPPDNAGGPPLYVVGIGARWAGDDAPRRALEAVPAGAARLVLMHNPDSLVGIPAGAAPVAIAGHTHGGQVRLPLVSRWFWLHYKGRSRLPRAGWITGNDGAPGNALYVNRGIGFSRWPIRINARPELTYLTLETASSSTTGAGAACRQPGAPSVAPTL